MDAPVADTREESTHVSLLAVVREVAADVASLTDPDACLRRLRSGLIRLGFSRAGIWETVDSDPTVVHGTWGTDWHGNEVDQHGLSSVLAKFVGAAAILRGDHVVLNRVEPQGTDRAALGLPLVEAQGPPNRACVALRADGLLMAIISVDMLPSEKTIDPEHVAALEVVADQVAAAIAGGRVMSALRVELAERRLVEVSLRESDERLRFVVEHTGDAFYRLRFDTMLYDYVSPSIEALIGYSADELQQVSWDAIIEERTTIQGGPITEEYLVSFQTPDTIGSFHADYLVKTKSGEHRWIEDRSEPWRDRDGTLLGSVGILSNITEVSTQ